MMRPPMPSINWKVVKPNRRKDRGVVVYDPKKGPFSGRGRLLSVASESSFSNPKTFLKEQI